MPHEHRVHRDLVSLNGAPIGRLQPNDVALKPILSRLPEILSSKLALASGRLDATGWTRDLLDA
jgi:hypothetical protein